MYSYFSFFFTFLELEPLDDEIGTSFHFRNKKIYIYLKPIQVVVYTDRLYYIYFRISASDVAKSKGEKNKASGEYHRERERLTVCGRAARKSSSRGVRLSATLIMATLEIPIRLSVILLSLSIVASQEFTPPPATVTPFDTKGVRISIPREYQYFFFFYWRNCW